MRGAILHKMGLNAIKERVMRRHYGVEYKAPFEEGVHPEHMKARNAAGTIVCRSACRWYANKVYLGQYSWANRDRVKRCGKDILSNIGLAPSSMLNITSPMEQLRRRQVFLSARTTRPLLTATILVFDRSSIGL